MEVREEKEHLVTLFLHVLKRHGILWRLCLHIYIRLLVTSQTRHVDVSVDQFYPTQRYDAQSAQNSFKTSTNASLDSYQPFSQAYLHHTQIKPLNNADNGTTSSLIKCHEKITSKEINHYRWLPYSARMSHFCWYFTTNFVCSSPSALVSLFVRIGSFT